MIEVLNKLNKEATYHDKLVVIEENGTADIASIYDIDDTRISADSSSHDYSVPLADVQAFVGPVGRIYVLNADSEYVSDTRRLAALEKSIVLRQVTHFEREKEDEKRRIDIKQIMLFALIAVLLLGVIFK